MTVFLYVKSEVYFLMSLIFTGGYWEVNDKGTQSFITTLFYLLALLVKFDQLFQNIQTSQPIALVCRRDALVYHHWEYYRPILVT